MPELPEVELFRHLLLPLVSQSERQTLTIERVGENPRIQWHGESGVESVRHGFVCTDVMRRGKQLCLVLQGPTKSKGAPPPIRYLYLHMGMTGRIRIPGVAENWGAKQADGTVVKTDLESHDSTEESVPKYTYLIFSLTNAKKTTYTAYFCDPRKFGSCYLTDTLDDLNALAPDALTCIDPTMIEQHILPALTNQRLGIKAILLDQKRAVSGVGNWVADEVLYQCAYHPDQTRLFHDEAVVVWHTLQSIVTVAVHALTVDRTHYPETWLFGYRWTKKKATRDAHGRTVTFLQSGGRTSAIVPSLQKLAARSKDSARGGATLNSATTSPTRIEKSNVTKATINETVQTSPSRKRIKASASVVDAPLRRKSPRLKESPL